MDAAAIVTAAVEFLKALFGALSYAFKTAFSNPLGGLLIGGFLFVLGRLGKALEAAGILVVAISIIVLVVQALGIKLPPWPLGS